MTTPVLERFLGDERDTALLGNDLAAALRPGEIVALSGDLGAGKTTLARATIRALAGDPELEVTSPTFTLVQTYEARLPVSHFDLYRIASTDELEELGFDEAGAEGIVMVEWPEQAGGGLHATLRIELTQEGSGRRARISGSEDALQRLRHSFDIRHFLAEAGMAQARRTYLLGDASVRAYETIETGDDTLILMDAPERHDEPVVRDGLPYSRIAHLAQSVREFAAVADALRHQGFTAPAIVAHDYAHGLLVIEHLGSGSFLDSLGAPIAARYAAAGELLAALHQCHWPDRLPIPGGGVHHLPPYDHGALGIETQLLLDWYLPYMTGMQASRTVRERYEAIWHDLFGRLDGAETSLVLRDFHSPNIIWREDRGGLDRLGLIDVQDALSGPAAYDVAALALDARVDMTEGLERCVVEAYCGARGSAGAFDRTRFEEAYAITAAQRNSKLLGTFVRLDRRDGKPGYLKHLPRIRDYVRRALRHPALSELAAFYDEAALLDEPRS